jgi:glucosamine-6-phosphate deaminase
MEVTIARDYDALSRLAADIIIRQVQNKRDSVLVFPGGDTPIGMLSELVKAVNTKQVDFSGCTFVSLDEWVGLNGDDEGSCRCTLNRHFYEPARIDHSQIQFFNAEATDLQAECIRMDDLIAACGGIDLIVLGIGLNAHVGFNEPGIPWNTLCHVVELDEITKTVANKYFPNGTDHVHKGITIGMQHILRSKQVVLLANGEKKKEIVYRVIHGSVTTDVPASALKNHSNCSIIVDESCWDVRHL